jgi:hypothetical protein
MQMADGFTMTCSSRQKSLKSWISIFLPLSRLSWIILPVSSKMLCNSHLRGLYYINTASAESKLVSQPHMRFEYSHLIESSTRAKFDTYCDLLFGLIFLILKLFFHKIFIASIWNTHTHTHTHIYICQKVTNKYNLKPTEISTFVWR